MPLADANTAAYVPAPEMAAAAAAAGEAGVYQITVGTTGLIYQVPADWKGSWVRVRTSATIHLYFTATAPVALPAANQASTATSGTGTVSDPFLGLVPNDQTAEQVQAPGDEFWVSPSAEWFGVIADAADTEVTIRRAGWKGGAG